MGILPFKGSKKKYIKYFNEALDSFNDKCVFVDLFGGGLSLSIAIKDKYPNAKVICNDYDNQRLRYTNLDDYEFIASNIDLIIKDYKLDEKINETDKEKIIKFIESQQDKRYIDYLLLSNDYLYCMNMVKTLEEFRKSTLYKRKNKYTKFKRITFDNIQFECCDYKLLIEKYKKLEDVVFIADPPFFNTNHDAYKEGINLCDSIKLPSLLGNKFIYYESGSYQIESVYKAFNQDVFNDINKIIYKCVAGRGIKREEVLYYKY